MNYFSCVALLLSCMSFWTTAVSAHVDELAYNTPLLRQSVVAEDEFLWIMPQVTRVETEFEARR